jgi:hypothetical protein
MKKIMMKLEKKNAFLMLTMDTDAKINVVMKNIMKGEVEYVYQKIVKMY